MKKIFRLFGISLVAAAALVSCTEKDMSVVKPTLVGITKADSYFADNSAQIEVALSRRTEQPVTVSFGTGNDLSSFGEVIPAAALNIPASVTIPAGDSLVTATVSVNADQLPWGKYQANIAIVASSGAETRSNASTAAIRLVNGDLRPHVNLTAFGDEFGTEGEVTITLSTPTETEATVTIGVSADSEVPAAAVTLTPAKVTIPANKDKATVAVKIDKSKLTENGEYEIDFEATAVSDNLINDGVVAGYFVFNIVPSFQESWQGMYYGPYGDDDAFLVDGITDEYWDLYYVPKGTVPSSVVGSLILYLQNRFEAFCEKYSSYPRWFLCDFWFYSGTSCLVDPVDPGEYDAFIVGFDEDGYTTGKYGKFSFEVEDTSPTEEYAQWIGNWELSDGTVITISPKVNNTSFQIDGIEGLATATNKMSAVAEFDAETGGFTITAQAVRHYTHDTYGGITDELTGLITYSGKNYYVDDEDLLLATVTMGSDGAGILTPGTYNMGTEAAPTLLAIVGMKYYGVLDSGAGALRYSDTFTALPDKMVKVEENELSSSIPGLKVRNRTLPANVARNASLDNIKRYTGK